MATGAYGATWAMGGSGLPAGYIQPHYGAHITTQHQQSPMMMTGGPPSMMAGSPPPMMAGGPPPIMIGLNSHGGMNSQLINHQQFHQQQPFMSYPHR